MTFAFRCQCSQFAGEIVDPRDSWHVACYCRDCQAYAHALGRAAEVLDGHGGTHVIAVRPRQLQFTRGRELLRCLSLAPGGLLRWYAACCGTPIANTPRDRRTAYAGLVHSCLAESLASLEKAYGPLRYQANVRGATRPPPRVGALESRLALASLMFALFRGRVGGSWRLTPFFDPATGKPLATPKVLTPEQLQKVRALAGG